MYETCQRAMVLPHVNISVNVVYTVTGEDIVAHSASPRAWMATSHRKLSLPLGTRWQLHGCSARAYR